MMVKEDEKTYSVTDVTRIFLVSRQTAMKWISDGEFGEIEKSDEIDHYTSPWIIPAENMRRFCKNRIHQFDARIHTATIERDRLSQLEF